MKKQKNHSRIYKIDGVGVNLERFYPVQTVEQKNDIRKKYGFSEGDFILIYTAEFIKRKNHALLFEILPEIKKEIQNLKVLLCGKGELLNYYKEYAATKKMDYISFIGYTKDVAEYCRISDILVMPSFQEGLPMGMIEGIATGLPVVASNIRGHCDVINDGENGFLCDVKNPQVFKDKILELYNNLELRMEIGKKNIERAEKYSIENALQKMTEIYKTVM